MNKEVEQSEIIKNQAKNIERKVRWGNVDDILDENLSPSSYCLVHNYIIDLHKEIEELQKKAELGEHYKHLYSEVKKQKDELEKENRQLKEKLNCKEYFSSTMPEGTEFVILTKNNYDRQQKDLVLENIQLKKQKDDVVEYIKKNWYSKNTRDINEIVIGDWRIDLLRMLGEIDD